MQLSQSDTHTKQEKKVVVVTKLFHVAAEVHTCHSVPVTLEVSFKGWIRLHGQRDSETFGRSNILKPGKTISML